MAAVSRRAAATSDGAAAGGPDCDVHVHLVMASCRAPIPPRTHPPCSPTRRSSTASPPTVSARSAWAGHRSAGQRRRPAAGRGRRDVPGEGGGKGGYAVFRPTPMARRRGVPEYDREPDVGLRPRHRPRPQRGGDGRRRGAGDPHRPRRRRAGGRRRLAATPPRPRPSRAGAQVARHPFNLGVGAALRTGFRYADARGYLIAIQVDADGQHVATEAHTLLELVGSGARRRRRRLPLRRRRGGVRRRGHAPLQHAGALAHHLPSSRHPHHRHHQRVPGLRPGRHRALRRRPTRPPTSPTRSRRCCSPRTGASPWSRCPSPCASAWAARPRTTR